MLGAMPLQLPRWRHDRFRRTLRNVVALVGLVVVGLGGAIVVAKTLVDCGGEGESACTILDEEYFGNGNKPCDRGLTLRVPGNTCENHQRRIAKVDPWIAWALRNQETVAIDEPINWTSRLATHNAFNNWADDYPIPNQYWSLTDQLRLGSRHFQLDIHWFAGQLRLCHAPDNHAGCSPDDRLYAYGIKEIRDWLASNPGQIVTIDFEDRSDQHSEDVEDPLEAYFGDDVYRPLASRQLGRLPTLREMAGPHFGPVPSARKGRVLVIDPYDEHSGRLLLGNHVFSQKSGLITNPDTGEANLAFNPVARDCRTGVSTWGHSNGPGILPGFDVFRFNWSAPKDRFSWIAEDRVFARSVGLVDEIWVEFAVRCGISLVYLDQYAQPRHTGDTDPVDFRHAAAIWSWGRDDFGDSGDAALLLREPTTGAQGIPWNRWASRDPMVIRPFACSRPRSESGGDPTTWPDKPGSNWRVTVGAGTWFEGGRQCLEEFGEAWVFSVPRSGYQNVQLSSAMGPTDVWLNYNDIGTESTWNINRRPVANAGPDQTLQCTGNGGAIATLDASASHDSLPPPMGDPDYSATLAYDWPAAGGASSNPTRDLFVPAGSHAFRLIVDDTMSGVDQDETRVTVIDTIPPVIAAATPFPSVLWPPNGKMVPVTVSVNASDVCSPHLDCRIMSVTSSETNAGNKKGSTSGPDYEITGPLQVQLRSERLGSGQGRIYMLTVRCSDAAGNSSEKAVYVTVPHDQR
jgi:hypothetical protein